MNDFTKLKKALYAEYCLIMSHKNEEPLSFREWVKMVNNTKIK